MSENDDHDLGLYNRACTLGVCVCVCLRLRLCVQASESVCVQGERERAHPHIHIAYTRWTFYVLFCVFYFININSTLCMMRNVLATAYKANCFRGWGVPM